MKIYDISMTIEHDMVVYKNKEEKRPVFTTVSKHSDSGVHETRLFMDAHCGTHLDAPLHMIDNGETIDKFNLNLGVSKCKVIDLTTVENKISESDLSNKKITKGDYILLKTKNSYEDFFNPEFIYLDESGAKYLKEQEIIGVGIDAVGIERSQTGHETHKILLDAGITILEGLRLRDVKEGEYSLVALPLKIRGVEASPVRAILIREDS